MQNLVLVKHSIENEDQAIQLSQIYNKLYKQFNCCILLVQQDNAVYLPRIPIFSGKDILNFYGIGVALDTKGAIIMEKAPLEHTFYFPINGTFDHTTITKISSLEPVVSLLKKQANKETDE